MSVVEMLDKLQDVLARSIYRGTEMKTRPFDANMHHEEKYRFRKLWAETHAGRWFPANMPGRGRRNVVDFPVTQPANRLSRTRPD
jgi:hypothetical protein